MSRFWTCRRQKHGRVCLTVNAARKRNCSRCGLPRRPLRKATHLRALETPYDELVALHGERCAICGAPPKTRRLNRDHDHAGDGRIRGLLCSRCNRALPNWITPQWLRQAADYLDRQGPGAA